MMICSCGTRSKMAQFNVDSFISEAVQFVSMFLHHFRMHSMGVVNFYKTAYKYSTKIYL